VDQGSTAPAGPNEDRNTTPSLESIGYLQDEERAQRLAAKVAAGADGDLLGVSRAVVFLTARCPLDCVYCRSRAHPAPDWPTSELHSLLHTLAEAGATHVQWTGGEATVDPRLPELLRRCEARGMNSSLSTNGCAGPRLYGQLADAGLGRVYVSLDQLDEPTFDRLTRTRGQLGRVLAGLGALVAARRALGRPHVTVNVALDREQVVRLMADGGRRLRDLLRWLLRSGVDDFKFLPLSTDPGGPCFPLPERLPDFLSTCRQLVPQRYEMFHLRLNTLAHGGHGFRDRRPRRCYLALDDRCYDSQGAYACVVQLREGGRRLWRASATPVQRRAALRAFVHADRSEDPLCRRYCFDLYRRINTRVSTILADKP